MNKRILVLFFVGLICVSVLYSEETAISNDEGVPSVTMQTFYTLKILWTDFLAMHYANVADEETSFALSEYQNQLFECLTILLQDYSDDSADKVEDRAISADLYPFILSEIYFYQYIVANKPEFNIIEYPKLDEAVESVMAVLLLDDDQMPLDSEFWSAETVHTVNSLFSHFNLLTDTETAFSTSSEEELMVFTSDYQQKLLFLNAFSNLEVFISKGNLSIENIVQLLSNPLSVFILFLNSDYEYLQEDVFSAIAIYEDIFENSIADDINKNILAVYDCYSLFTATELSAQTYGVPVKSIIPSPYANLYKYLRTAPLMVVAFSENELRGLNQCLAYLSLAGELYVSRINALTFIPMESIDIPAEVNNLDETTATTITEGVDSE